MRCRGSTCGRARREPCVGCHHERNATPPLVEPGMSQALRMRAAETVGAGEPHRFRGNNSGVTGMMDLQFERFRETASLNRHRDDFETWGRDATK